MLSEPRIQRYARQILLRDVGGVGQEALGARGVWLDGRGPLFSAAATYLRAGGTAVESSADAGAWAPGPPLLDTAPRNWMQVGSRASRLLEPCVVVGVNGGAIELWSVGSGSVIEKTANGSVPLLFELGGCLQCAQERLGADAGEEAGSPRAVVAGGALALLVQRRLLGLAADLEGLAVSAAGTVTALEAPRCMHRAPALPAPALTAVLTHLRSVWPEEGCGVLLEGLDGTRFLPLENAQAAHHARDPDAFPRDPRRAFTVEPATWLRLMKEVEARGDRIIALVHSHPEGPPHFSEEDRRQAAPEGLPLFPEMAHLVVAFERGAPVKAVWALWRGSGFGELDCPLPP